MSDAQLEIWSGCNLFPERSLHDLAVVFDLAGIDPRELEASFLKVAAEEPLLRARLVESSSGPALEIACGDGKGGGQCGSPAALFELRDLRALGLPERERAIASEARRPLDATRELFRSILFEVGESRFAWLFVIHHLIADGTSIKVLLERVAAALGRAEDRGPSCSAPPRARVGTRESQSSPAGRRARRNDEHYWRSRLLPALPALDLYGTRPAALPGVVRSEVKLDGSAASELKAAAASLGGKSEHIALLNLLTAALAVYLHRASGASELAIGMPFANRHTKAEREGFGLYMRIGVVRLSIDSAESIGALARRVAAETEEASRHLRAVPANTRNRHFEVMLNYHNLRYPQIGSAPLVEHWLHSANDTLPFTFHVRTSPPDGTLLVQLDLQIDRFPPEVRASALRQLLHVLQQVATRPELPAGEVELEERRVLADLYARVNATSRDLPGDSIPALFRRRAKEGGAEIAIFDEQGGATSYAELDERSDLLAGHLRDSGVARGAAVAGYLPRSSRAVVAILAAVKAGCIWVPLDPAYPASRIAFMLRDSGAKALLCDAQGAAELRAAIDEDARGGVRPDRELRLVVLDNTGLPERHEKPGGRGAEASRPPEDAGASLDDPTYCLYTSGSTGLPKGVVGAQRAIVNRLRWMWKALPLEPGEALLHKTSLCFIDSLWEIFGALLAGHPIVVTPEAALRDPASLARLMSRYLVRRIILVPSLLSLLVRQAREGGESLAGVRRWLVTGELLHASMVEELRRVHPKAEIYNLYGTSETFDAACYPVPNLLPAESCLPIGFPIDNTRLYVIDEAMRPLPAGIRGELLIAGAGVPAGYLDRPELSALRFPARFPFDAEAGGSEPSRFFRTGDLARLLPEGSFECCGRLDGQVKVRGYRIELEEVERALQKHPDVERAAAVRLDEEGEGWVAAFVQPRRRTSVEKLRSSLREKLPVWMLPEIRLVSTIPLTPSGKVDRVGLSAGLSAAIPQGGSAGASRKAGRGEGEGTASTKEERQLAALWRRLLHVSRVLPEDNFFDLGGSSLLAVRLVAAVERHFGARLPLSALFETPTLRSFARAHLGGPRRAGGPRGVAERQGIAEPRRASGPHGGAQQGSVAESQGSGAGEGEGREFDRRVPRPRLPVLLRGAASTGVPVVARRAASEESARHSAVRREQPGKAAPEFGSAGLSPIFSVPPAGSTVSAFAGLARGLPLDQPLYSFQPLGVERDEKPLTSIEELADDYIAQMRAIQAHGPYLLVGRCFGGYVAYEMAQRLLGAGEEVAGLIIIDSREAPLDLKGRRLHTGLRKLVSYYPARVAYFRKRGELAGALRTKIRNEVGYRIALISSLVAGSGRRAREHRLRLLRHLHTLAYHRYLARPIDCPITMIWAGASPDLTGEREKWQSLAKRGIEWHTVDCDHHGLMKGRHLERVAEVIRVCASRAEAEGVTAGGGNRGRSRLS